MASPLSDWINPAGFKLPFLPPSLLPSLLSFFPLLYFSENVLKLFFQIIKHFSLFSHFPYWAIPLILMKSILNSMKNWRVFSEILNAFSLFFLLLSSLVSRGQWIIPSLLHCGVIIHYGVAIISFSISIPENECFQCKAHLYQYPYFYSFLDCFSKDLLNLEIQYHILLLGTEEPHRKPFDRGCR